MGCISSKLDINDKHPNIFQVTNVDEMGHFVSPGQLEVTETELVLHQRGKPPTRWPVRCLRKYGFDSEIFTFESGRRCPTGAGIYAFKCRKAEQLFNMLQQNIQLRNLNDDNLTGLNANLVSSGVVTGEFPVPLVSTGPPVHRRLPSISDGYLNPTTTASNVRPHGCLSRPGSVTSNGPNSPVSPPPVPTNDVSFEHNNNKQGGLLVDHSYTNTSIIANAVGAPMYINCGLAPSPIANEHYVNVVENSQHLYMNVAASDNQATNAKDLPKILTDVPDLSAASEVEDARHCYVNVNVNESEFVRPPTFESIPTPGPYEPPPNSLFAAVQEVNYVELDLENAKGTKGVGNPGLVESPSKVKKSYATIDFNKTNALSQSVNPRMDNEEGSRKTRHNSTISDVPTRHSNSSSD